MTEESSSPKPVIFASLAYLGLAVACTWPLAAKMRSAVPGDLGDPLLNIWILWWDLTRISSFDFSGYFNGNVMFPYANTLSFSEHLTGQAVLGLPFWLATRNAVFVYNALYILSFVIAGAGAFVLARRLSGSSAGAFVAGLIFAFAPYRFHQTGHLQVLASGFIPLVFHCLIRLCERPGPAAAAALAACYLMQSASNLYFAVYLAVACPVIAAVFCTASRTLFDWRLWFWLAVAAAVTALPMLPFISAYRRMAEDMAFTRDLSMIASVRGPAGFFGTTPLNFAWGGLLQGYDIPEGGLFPGMTALACAAAGLFFAGARRGTRPAFAALALLAVPVTAGPGFTLELHGMKLDAGIAYRVLYEWFPGFSSTRVPMRFHVMTMLSIAVLAACGIALACRPLGRRAAFVLAAVLSAAAALEYATPVPAVEFPAAVETPKLYSALRDLPDGPVIEFPVEGYYKYAFNATIHRKRAFTAVTGFISPLNGAVNHAQRNPGDPFSLRLLESMGIRYVVVGRGGPDPRLFEAGGGPKLSPLYRDGDGEILELHGRGARYFDPGTHLRNFKAVRSGDCALGLMAEVAAAPDRPVVALALGVRVKVRLMKNGAETAAFPARLSVPPVANQLSVAWTEIRPGCGAAFDEVVVEAAGKRFKADIKTPEGG